MQTFLVIITGKNNAVVSRPEDGGDQTVCCRWNLGCFTQKLSSDYPSVMLALTLIKNLFTIQSLEKLAQQRTEVCPTTLSGYEVNGTAVIVIAGEDSQSAFLLDAFITISVQLNVIHYSLEIENIKSIMKIQASKIRSWHRLLGWSVSKKNRQVKLRRGSTMVIKLALNQPYSFTNLYLVLAGRNSLIPTLLLLSACEEKTEQSFRAFQR